MGILPSGARQLASCHNVVANAGLPDTRLETVRPSPDQCAVRWRQYSAGVSVAAPFDGRSSEELDGWEIVWNATLRVAASPAKRLRVNNSPPISKSGAAKKGADNR